MRYTHLLYFVIIIIIIIYMRIYSAPITNNTHVHCNSQWKTQNQKSARYELT